MTTLVIGSSAVGSDGYRGEVQAVVVDPAARTVTHLVVEPHGRAGLARLVPIGLADLVRSADRADRAEERPGQVRLRCTEAEFMSLEAAEETLAEFVPGYPDPVQLLPPAGATRAALPPTAARSCESRKRKPSMLSRRARWRSTEATAYTPPTARPGTSAPCASTRTAAG